jgi:hypothetical protein
MPENTPITAQYWMVVPVDKVSDADDKAAIWDTVGGQYTFTKGVMFYTDDPDVVTYRGAGTLATADQSVKIELLPSEVSGTVVYKDQNLSYVMSDMGLSVYQGRNF